MDEQNVLSHVEKVGIFVQQGFAHMTRCEHLLCLCLTMVWYTHMWSPHCKFHHKKNLTMYAVKNKELTPVNWLFRNMHDSIINCQLIFKTNDTEWVINSQNTTIGIVKINIIHQITLLEQEIVGVTENHTPYSLIWGCINNTWRALLQKNILIWEELHVFSAGQWTSTRYRHQSATHFSTNKLLIVLGNITQKSKMEIWMLNIQVFQDNVPS
jgi:hypothetical protein